MSAHQQSQLRLLAPAAIALFAIAFLIVVIASLGGGDETSTSERPAAAGERERPGTAQRREPRTITRDSGNPRFYRVRAGDNLALIAEKTGVTLAELRELNPSLDPQALVTGQRVRLRASGTSGTAGATGATGAQGDTSSPGGIE
jgi:hypothetical protein